MVAVAVALEVAQDMALTTATEATVEFMAVEVELDTPQQRI